MEDYSGMTAGELAELIAAQSPNIIQKLSKKEHLELLGKYSSGDQILALLSQYPGNKEKIGPIFVGMDEDKFEELLLKASDKQLDVLKSEGFSEAISHHLTLFAHRVEEENGVLFKKLTAIEGAIRSMDPEITAKETIAELKENLTGSLEQLAQLSAKVKKAIAIVWSTSNIELIDKLNRAHIALQRMWVSSELEALFSQKLFSVYHDLKDDDAAIDGMANFSVWYLEDYVEVGLLSAQKSEQSRETLFRQVRERLEGLHLKTIGDLKRASIFSRQTLKDYIRQHR